MTSLRRTAVVSNVAGIIGSFELIVKCACLAYELLSKLLVRMSENAFYWLVDTPLYHHYHLSLSLSLSLSPFPLSHFPFLAYLLPTYPPPLPPLSFPSLNHFRFPSLPFLFHFPLFLSIIALSLSSPFSLSHFAPSIFSSPIFPLSFLPPSPFNFQFRGLIMN